MKKWPLFLSFCCLCFCAAAQPSKEQLEEMQKKLRKQMDSVMNLPQVKNRAKNHNDVLTSPPAADRPITAGGGNSSFDKIELPKKDSIKLKNIPKKTFSAEELRAYITDLHTQIAKKLPAATVSKVNQMLNEAKTPGDIETGAMLAYHGGAYEEAVLLITKGASQSGDGILLTNAGAILDMTGLSDKAIPILRTVVAQNPSNFIAQNNLGQAYTALGQLDSALYYFGRCLSFSSEHPEANNTAGVIELKRGNTAKAQQHFENSIRGGYNASAYAGLKHILKNKTRIAHLIRPKIKMPEYFNQFKYKLPRQQLTIIEAAAVEQEQKQFRETIMAAARVYQTIAKEAEKAFAKRTPGQFNAAIYAKVQKGESYLRPFQLLGATMEAETILEYNDDTRDLQHFNTVNRQQYKDLELEYKKKYDAIWKRYGEKDDDCCGEGDVSCCNDDGFCRETNSLKNQYLPKFAALNEEYQSRNLQVEIKHLDNLLYWGFFAAMDKEDYKMRFYQRVTSYLRTLQRLDVIKILKPCQYEPDEEKEKEEKEAVKEMDCPFSLQIPLGVAKISIDCESWSVKAGKGVVFRYEKNFVSRQSTMSLGLGGELFDSDVKYGGLDLKLNMSMFLTFDARGNLSDGGLVSEAKGTASYGFEGGTKLKFKEGIGWRLGYNSGLSLTPGRLKNLIDKIGPAPETQVNKNVPIYKPRQ